MIWFAVLPSWLLFEISSRLLIMLCSNRSRSELSLAFNVTWDSDESFLLIMFWSCDGFGGKCKSVYITTGPLGSWESFDFSLSMLRTLFLGDIDDSEEVETSSALVEPIFWGVFPYKVSARGITISWDGFSIILSGYRESENFAKVGLMVFSWRTIFGGVGGLRLGEYDDVEDGCWTQLRDLDCSLPLETLDVFLPLFWMLDNDFDLGSLPSRLSENTNVFVLSFEFF